MSKFDELKPCPFCGGAADRVYKSSGQTTHIECSGCKAQFPKSTMSNRYDEAWNTRTPGWIPVTERLPETQDHVLVSCKTKKGVKVVNRSYYNGKHWAGVMSEVKAWMPLPAPYSGDDE